MISAKSESFGPMAIIGLSETMYSNNLPGIMLLVSGELISISNKIYDFF